MKRRKHSLPDAVARKSSQKAEKASKSVIQVCIIRRRNVKIVSGSAAIKSFDRNTESGKTLGAKTLGLKPWTPILFDLFLGATTKTLDTHII
jgi:hypothetical protein